ncbi:ExeA family protein [Stratiformator vulcanicus]|uniref:ORC1/DEAH AAA+ ATPase domain-containing protein n=1 Tax=Stratiformator vulcanicus TaxID=2527980 RepID=A0A517R5K1_9PLAN|nr:AAA family ATPase [Stratiformator vulcanicus]QDT39164.1 hypothetical protein Pan189_35670 [Stratiformator vulcanicus]
MDLHHWQLKRNPFRDGVESDVWCAIGAHAGASLKLRHVIESREGAAALIGEPGSGKSQLVHYTADEFSETERLTHVLNVPRCSAEDLLEEIVFAVTGDAGPALHPTRAIRRLARWAENAPDGAVVMIDDAQELGEDALRRAVLPMLRATERITVILSGTRPLLTSLRKIEPLAQRIAVTAWLTPLNENDVRTYIEQRLGCVDSNAQIFSDDALRSLSELSRGIPRLINRLAAFSMLLAETDQRETVRESDVERVASELICLPTGLADAA